MGYLDGDDGRLSRACVLRRALLKFQHVAIGRANDISETALGVAVSRRF
jgi:hypothetical protein